MVLSTHVVAGAALAQLFPQNPALGFGVAFVSHFVLDMIPHWDYRLVSLEAGATGQKIDKEFKINPAFVADLMKIGADLLLGLILAFLVFYPDSKLDLLILFLGVSGALLPDFLQFVFYKFRPFWLKPLQRFHIWIHARRDFNNRPVLGIVMQVVLAAIFILVLK